MPSPLHRCLSLQDFEPLARRLLPNPLFAYVSGAVEDELSAIANRASFLDYSFLPNVLVDVAHVDTSVRLLGEIYSAPIGIAPMGIAALTSYRGDIVLARAAAQAKVPCIMSGSSLIRLEEVMAQAPGVQARIVNFRLA